MRLLLLLFDLCGLDLLTKAVGDTTPACRAINGSHLCILNQRVDKRVVNLALNPVFKFYLSLRNHWIVIAVVGRISCCSMGLATTNFDFYLTLALRYLLSSKRWLNNLSSWVSINVIVIIVRVTFQIGI